MPNRNRRVSDLGFRFRFRILVMFLLQALLWTHVKAGGLSESDSHMLCQTPCAQVIFCFENRTASLLALGAADSLLFFSLSSLFFFQRKWYYRLPHVDSSLRKESLYHYSTAISMQPTGEFHTMISLTGEMIGLAVWICWSAFIASFFSAFLSVDIQPQGAMRNCW